MIILVEYVSIILILFISIFIFQISIISPFHLINDYFRLLVTIASPLLSLDASCGIHFKDAIISRVLFEFVFGYIYLIEIIFCSSNFYLSFIIISV